MFTCRSIPLGYIRLTSLLHMHLSCLCFHVVVLFAICNKGFLSSLAVPQNYEKFKEQDAC